MLSTCLAPSLVQLFAAAALPCSRGEVHAIARHHALLLSAKSGWRAPMPVARGPSSWRRAATPFSCGRTIHAADDAARDGQAYRPGLASSTRRRSSLAGRSSLADAAASEMEGHGGARDLPEAKLPKASFECAGAGSAESLPESLPEPLTGTLTEILPPGQDLLTLVTFSLPLQLNPALYEGLVATACAEQFSAKKVVRWYISSASASEAHVEAVIWREKTTGGSHTPLKVATSPAIGGEALKGAISRKGALLAASTALLAALGLPQTAAALSNADEFDDLGAFVRTRVKRVNDLLIEGNRQFNEKTYSLGKRLQGKGDTLNPTKAPPPLMDAEFASIAAMLPEQAYRATTGASASEAAALVAAVRETYRPYFERGIGSGLPDDIRNHTYFNFNSYCQWKAFLPRLSTRALQQRFLRELGEGGLRSFFAVPGAEKSYFGAAGSGGSALSREALPVYEARTGGLGRLLQGLTAALDVFRRAGYITGFALEADSIDDTSFVDGGPAAFSVFVDQEAPLSAKILLDYEGSNACLPDLLQATLARYMARCGVVAQYEQFYLDDRYRPDASNYTPTQTLVAWTLEEEAEA